MSMIYHITSASERELARTARGYRVSTLGRTLEQEGAAPFEPGPDGRFSFAPR